jgi:hypothetical protein
MCVYANLLAIQSKRVNKRKYPNGIIVTGVTAKTLFRPAAQVLTNRNPMLNQPSSTQRTNNSAEEPAK